MSLYDVKTNLSALVEEAAAGAEIVITKHGKPKARLVAVDRRDGVAGRRPLGAWKGKIRLLPGWDDPLPEAIFDCLSDTADEPV